MNKYQRDRELQMPQGETLPYRLEHKAPSREAVDPLGEGQLRLRLESEPGVLQSASAVWLHDDHPSTYPLERVHLGTNIELWQSLPIPNQLHDEYYFILQTTTGQALLGATGLQASMPKESRFRVTHCSTNGTPPWARGAIFYQIFPDRFQRLGPCLPGLERWDSTPTPTGFKGGNLRGIAARLDYLAELGIDGIYLNPIFASPSNHRYDTVDFYSIDPRLGNQEDLLALVDAAHARNIRVILDGVFNHVSDKHPFFLDVRARGRESRYWNWFKVRRWPFEAPGDEHYAAWWGHPHLPQLELSNPEVHEYLLGVGRHWLSEYELDGWRLDVAGEVPLEFWKEFRVACLAVRPSAYLLAEVWGDGRSFLQGDTFDATMNYPFRRVVCEFLLGRLDSSRAAEYLERLYYRYPSSTAQVQYNLLGSHDVSRIRHDLGGDLALVELALAIQCAFPGVMAIYYGDELGLSGAGDPGCREGMPWQDAEQAPLLTPLKELVRRRRERRELREGDFACRADGNHRLILERTLGSSRSQLTLDRQERCYQWNE